MKNDIERLRRLATPEFSRVLAADDELRRLERLKYDSAAEARLLLEAAGLGVFRIGRLPILPLTAAKWAFLWMLGNRFAAGDAAEVTETDVDVFLFILSLPDLRGLGIALEAIPAAASGLRAAPGLDDAALAAEINAEIRAAFLPLELLPPAPDSGDPPRFDALWLTRIAAVAARETGENAQSLMHDAPLSRLCCHYVNWRMREGSDGDRIGRRPDAELARLISARIDALGDEFIRGADNGNRL